MHELSKESTKAMELRLEVLREEVRRYVKSTQWNQANNDAFSRLHRDLSSLFLQERLVTKSQTALKSLHFDQINERHSDVPKSHGKTFEWIFAIDCREKSTEFMDWLYYGNDLFWISGKAGSGKSTLMKFLYNNKKTREWLARWAAPKKCIVGSHFFWNVGSRLQKSLEGLFRTLLFRVWSQCPELIPDSILHESNSPYHYPGSWTVKSLLKQLKAAGDAQDISRKFCFFIDGLDEYDGDHSDIVKDIRELSRCPNIKICVSSRPWTVFRDAFESSSNKLFLHELTYHDIEQYIQANLQAHTNFKILHHNDPTGSVSLVNSLRDKAQGVFLWVFLVVRSLLRGLQFGDEISDLKHRLDQLPPDLETYFRYIFNGIEAVYRQQTAQIFLTLLLAESSLPLLTLHFLECIRKDVDYPIRYAGEDIMSNEGFSIYEKQRRRLDARCGDLAEISEIKSESLFCRFQVRFLHRTVPDFLRTSEVYDTLQKWAGESFDPLETLCGTLLCQIKCNPPEWAKLIRLMLDNAKKIEIRYKRTPLALLENLNPLVIANIRGENSVSPRQNSPFKSCDIDFVQFASAYRLHLYVFGKIKARLEEDTHDLHQLLLFALTTPNITLGGTPLARCVDRKIDVYFVNGLLDIGADPNYIVGQTGQSVWEEFVLYLARMFQHELNFRYFAETGDVEKVISENGSLGDPNCNFLGQGKQFESGAMLHKHSESILPLTDEIFACWYTGCEVLLKRGALASAKDFFLLQKGFSNEQCANLKLFSVEKDLVKAPFQANGTDGKSQSRDRLQSRGLLLFLRRLIP